MRRKALLCTIVVVLFPRLLLYAQSKYSADSLPNSRLQLGSEKSLICSLGANIIQAKNSV
jgi:hypothetical protein